MRPALLTGRSTQQVAPIAADQGWGRGRSGSRPSRSRAWSALALPLRCALVSVLLRGGVLVARGMSGGLVPAGETAGERRPALAAVLPGTTRFDAGGLRAPCGDLRRSAAIGALTASAVDAGPSSDERGRAHPAGRTDRSGHRPRRPVSACGRSGSPRTPWRTHRRHSASRASFRRASGSGRGRGTGRGPGARGEGGRTSRHAAGAAPSRGASDGAFGPSRRHIRPTRSTRPTRPRSRPGPHRAPWPRSDDSRSARTGTRARRSPRPARSRRPVRAASSGWVDRCRPSPRQARRPDTRNFCRT